MTLKHVLAGMGGVLTVVAFLKWGVPVWNYAVEYPDHLAWADEMDAWRQHQQCMEDCLRGGGSEDFCIELCRRYLK